MNNATVAAPRLPSHPVLRGESFIILTDDKPRYPVKITAPLPEYLALAGFQFETIHGCYEGQRETSYIVFTDSTHWLSELAEEYGQECIILSQNGQNQLLFTNGPNKGRYHPGQGLTVFAEEPTDFYSTVQTSEGPVHFALGLDFETLLPALSIAS